MSEEQLKADPLIDPDIINNFANVRLAHEAMMIDKISKQNQIVMDSVKAMQPTNEVQKGDEDMGVSVGNKQYYYQSQPENGPQQPSTLVKLAPWIISALTAFGAPPAAMMFYKAMFNQALPANQNQELDYDLGFGNPETRPSSEAENEGT